MLFKKYILMLSLAIVTVISLPSFVSAKEIDFLGTKQFYEKSFSPEYTFKKGRERSYSYLFEKETIADLGEEVSVSSYSYSAQGGVQFSYIAFYDSDFRFLRQEKFDGPSNLVRVEGVRARYVSVGNTGRDSVRISSLYVYGDDGLVSDVSSLKATPEANKVTLNWKNPEGEANFKGVRIYQGNRMISELDNKITSYIANGLDAGKNYTFTVKSIDQNFAESKGTSVNTATSMPVIKPPENVFLTPQDKKLVIAWNDVNSPHLKGYNIYIDGKKINDEPLTTNKMIVKNLENNKSYNVQISAVNKEDVEGEKSKEKSDKPSSNALEVEYDVEIPFSPMDFLKTSLSFLGLISPFVLLALAITYHKRLAGLIKKLLVNYKERRKQ
ncbi:fibronectin type III domain-containing protein [Bacillus albus]|uniref:fibronectin type III domain-containing protein n=1 Tax=Bacillus albus TaxID=2026189 RepID=UPI0030151967